MKRNKNLDFISAKCPYCRGKVTVKNTNDVFVLPPKHLQDKEVLICENYPVCDSYVLKADEGEYQGNVASETLRRLRQITHCYVDIIWKTQMLERNSCYEYLAKQLNLSINKCHIRMFNEKYCYKTMNICSDYILKNCGKIKTYNDLTKEEINILKKIIAKEELKYD